MGRARKQVSDAQRELIKGLAAVLTNDQIADFLGMSRTTFYERIKEDEALRLSVLQGSAAGVTSVAQKLIKDALAGNTTAQIFFLKARGGWSDRRQVEISGPGGGAIAVEGIRMIDETKLTLEQRRALLAAVVAEETDDDASDES